MLPPAPPPDLPAPCWSAMPQEAGRFPEGLPVLTPRAGPTDRAELAVPGLPWGGVVCLWSPALGELRVEPSRACVAELERCARVPAPVGHPTEASRWWAAVEGHPPVAFSLPPRPAPAPAARCSPPAADASAARIAVDLHDGGITLWAVPEGARVCPVWSVARPSLLASEVSVLADGRLNLGLQGTWRMGEYPLDVGVPDGTVRRLTVRVPIPWAWLLSLSAGGLLASVGTAAIVRGAIRDVVFARRHARALARLRTADEDHEPLIARIQALLGFCGQRVRAGWSPRRLVDFDHVEPALQEAEQLLTLQGRKAALWRAAQAQGLPPTAAVRFAAWLRRMDEEILALRFPVDEQVLAAPLPAEAQARALLDDARLSFAEDVGGNLAGRAEAMPPRFDEAEAIALPALIARALGEERARLDAIGAREVRSPLALREADIRLDVLRALEAAQVALSRPGHYIDEQHVRRSLRRYREVDLREAAPTDVHHPMLRALRWTPQNRALAARLTAIHDGPEAPADPERALFLHVEVPSRWPTFEPTPLAVRLFDVQRRWHWLEETYLWRRLIQVQWTVRGGAVEPGAADLAKVQRDGDTVRWVSRGPRSAAFATRPGPIRVEACLIVPAPHVPKAIRKLALEADATAERSDEERHLRLVQWEGGRRMALNAVLTVAVVALVAWQAQDGRQGLLPYVWAALLPFDVDLSTGLALGNVGPGAAAVLQRWLQGK